MILILRIYRMRIPHPYVIRSLGEFPYRRNLLRAVKIGLRAGSIAFAGAKRRARNPRIAAISEFLIGGRPWGYFNRAAHTVRRNVQISAPPTLRIIFAAPARILREEAAIISAPIAELIRRWISQPCPNLLGAGRSVAWRTVAAVEIAPLTRR